MPFASTSRNALAAAALALLAAHAGAQSVFRGGTDLVALQVTVVDGQRRYVPDLRQEDFAVFEDGRPQAIELFAASAVPLDLMLLVDSSSSMTSRIPIVRRAAANLIRALGPDDRAEVIFFSTRVRIEQELTTNRRDLIAAVNRLHAAGSTALYEALYVALKRLA